jgi:porin
MRSGVRFFILMVLLNLAGVCMGGNEEYLSNSFCHDFWEQETLTNGFWGLNDQLSDKGIEMGFRITNVYQANVKGGLSTHNRKGRYVGRYDIELSADLGKLLSIEGGSFFIHGWGGWPDEEGIDGFSVGSYFGTNAVSVGNRGMDIVECFYEGSFFSDNLTLAIGKLDFTGIFDASEYADDECAQFLNASLVDDPAIPFPQQGLGAVLTWDVTNSWYIMGGIGDAQADGRETGFRTTFCDEDYFFYVLETGVTKQLNSANGPMPGTYRIGFWNDPQPKANSDATKSYRDDVGFYLSCDQMFAKENADPEDSQGLGTFFRYGYASNKRNDITNFWSFGFQYQGLIEGCDDDVFGVGFAQGIFSDKASLTYTDDYESVLEVYYNAKMTPWLAVSPSIQYIANPGGAEGVSDAVVLGMRVQMSF